MPYAVPDSFLDQLVVRFEVSYTPNKKFTATDVLRSFMEDDEWVSSLVFKKYHPFSDDIPATFFIIKWMHKSESDMLGRHLSGLGGDVNHLPGNGEAGLGWDGLVLPFSNPSLNLPGSSIFASMEFSDDVSVHLR